MMAGQAAEAAVFNDITTGASNDLQNATRVARKMVTEYGMSEELGPQTFDSGQDMVFLGKELAQRRSYSDAVAQKIDDEVGSLLRKARSTAKGLIELNRSRLNRLVEKLLAGDRPGTGAGGAVRKHRGRRASGGLRGRIRNGLGLSIAYPNSGDPMGRHYCLPVVTVL